MPQINYIIALISMSLIYPTQAIRAGDPCLSEGGTSPQVGYDACQNPVCDESLVAKPDELCCGNATIYKKSEITVTQSIDITALVKAYNDKLRPISEAFGFGNKPKRSKAAFSGTEKQ